MGLSAGFFVGAFSASGLSLAAIFYTLIGIAMGMVAFISGAIIGGIKSDKKWFLYLKIAIVCVLTFLICTVGINTTAFWILYSKSTYFTYLVSRLFVQGQIFNSILNYALLFIFIPALKGIKALKIYID